MQDLYKLIIVSEEDFKKKQKDSNVLEVLLSKLDEIETLEAFLIRNFKATDVKQTSANWILHERTGDIPSHELPNQGLFAFHYIVRDYDVVLFKVPEEERSYLAYFSQDTVHETLSNLDWT